MLLICRFSFVFSRFLSFLPGFLTVLVAQISGTDLFHAGGFQCSGPGAEAALDDGMLRDIILYRQSAQFLCFIPDDLKQLLVGEPAPRRISVVCLLLLPASCHDCFPVLTSAIDPRNFKTHYSNHSINARGQPRLRLSCPKQDARNRKSLPRLLLRQAFVDSLLWPGNVSKEPSLWHILTDYVSSYGLRSSAQNSWTPVAAWTSSLV